MRAIAFIRFVRLMAEPDIFNVMQQHLFIVRRVSSIFYDSTNRNTLYFQKLFEKYRFSGSAEKSMYTFPHSSIIVITMCGRIFMRIDQPRIEYS